MGNTFFRDESTKFYKITIKFKQGISFVLKSTLSNHYVYTTHHI